MDKQAYIEGFVRVCEIRGVDPDALIKLAVDPVTKPMPAASTDDNIKAVPQVAPTNSASTNNTSFLDIAKQVYNKGNDVITSDDYNTPPIEKALRYQWATHVRPAATNMLAKLKTRFSGQPKQIATTDSGIVNGR